MSIEWLSKTQCHMVASNVTDTRARSEYCSNIHLFVQRSDRRCLPLSRCTAPRTLLSLKPPIPPAAPALSPKSGPLPAGQWEASPVDAAADFELSKAPAISCTFLWPLRATGHWGMARGGNPATHSVAPLPLRNQGLVYATGTLFFDPRSRTPPPAGQAGLTGGGGQPGAAWKGRGVGHLTTRPRPSDAPCT